MSSRSPGLLQHSNWDGLLIALSITHAVVLLAMPSIPVIAIGLWWNSNTISHNFVHLPFFRSRRLNRLYSIYLTLLLGIPQSLWRARHLAHHAGKPRRIRLNNWVINETMMVVGLWTILFAADPRFF